MPTSSSKSDYAKNAFLGKAAAVDDDNFINPLQWKPKIVAKTTDYTCKATESGTIFTSEGATADIEFTTPDTDEAWVLFFYNAEDVEMKVSTPTGNELVTFNNAAADSVNITTASEQIGAGFMIVCGGNDLAYAFGMLSGNTLTVVDA